MTHRRKLAIAAAVIGAAGTWGVIEAGRVPLPAALDGPPPAARVLLDARGEVFHVVPVGDVRDGRPLELEKMGPYLPALTIAVEDRRFYSHPGIDPLAICAAAWRNLRAGRVVSGASTITQQLIKLTSGRTKRSLGGKIYEALAAVKLERRWTKNQILEAYLNRLDYGNRRFGPEAAARAYFAKPAAALTPAEALFLAGLPQSPGRLNPWVRPARADARYHRNAARLVRSGLEFAGAIGGDPPVVLRTDPPREAPVYAAAALREAGPGPLVLRTALDRDLQAGAGRMCALQLVSSRGFRDLAVAVVSIRDGKVVALAAAGPSAALPGAGEFPRSCGSTLKPFLYARALDTGRFTAASLLPDIPDPPFKDYQPRNYAGRYLGPVRLREALGNSLNVPAIHVLAQLGARDTFASMRSWGLALPGRFDDYGAGFILGNAPVTPAELAGAYAALARGGLAWKPSYLKSPPGDATRAASPEACAIIADILCDNSARQTSFGAHSPLALGVRTAAKTGTSSNFRDGWCAGFTDTHAVAAWAGNIDGTPMPELLAVRSAAPLWAAVTRHLHELGDGPVPAPALPTTRVSRLTGLLPAAGEPALEEFFLPGTAPAETSAGLFVAGRLVLPELYARWCASPHNHLGAQVAGGAPRILFPPDGSAFEFHPGLPAGRQMFRAQSSDDRAEWFLNGKRLSSPFVPLSPGKHTIEARSASGAASARFEVVSNP